MPSLFPGMDPYLESQHYWPDFHQRFMNYWCEAIADTLPDNYDARLEERVRFLEVAAEDRTVRRPDLAVSQSYPSATAPESEGGTATLEPVTLTLPIYEEFHESRIRILHHPDQTLVALLELLSPGNKTGTGRNDYLAKRIEILMQRIHLIELDLLLGGQRLPMREPLPPSDFQALVSRGDRRPKTDVYAWTLRQPLPTIRIPLRAPDPDIRSDLGSVFTTAYERGRYARVVKYADPLTVPLPPDELAWAEGMARSRSRAS